MRFKNILEKTEKSTMKFLDVNTDVLAVKCIQNYIFIGVGCSLYIVNKVDSKVKVKINALHPDNIHDIILRKNNQIIVYGARSLCLFNIDINDDYIGIEKSGEIHTFKDWIIKIVSSKVNDPNLLILFAHNYVYNYELNEKQFHNTTCTESCLLYAGTISEAKENYAIIFSGTVFQEILIWKVQNDNNNKFSEVLHRLKGHKGVIFSVFYDPLNNLICSTSDDRTVRLWTTSHQSAEQENVDWESLDISLKITMYGHIARVWKAISLKNIIASIGEDSRICFWNLNGELLHKIEAHRGAPIWCIDISDDGIIFTGGADGSVNSWPLSTVERQMESYILPKADKDQVPKHVVFLDNCDILLYSAFKNTSHILHFDGVEIQMRNSYELPKHSSSYCIMEISLDREYIALASIKGEITLYKKLLNNTFEEYRKYKISDSKILSMQWLNLNTILVCLPEGNLFIIKLSIEGYEILSEHILPQSRERWVTSAILYENLLICGDRMGSIFVYTLQPNSIHPVQSLKKIHGRLGVQSCMIMNDNLVTTGRDGTIKFYKFCNIENDELAIEFLYSRSMPMDWVSRVLTNQDDHFILGFKGDDFVIYSMSFKRILIKIPCGGGHRSWDCLIRKGQIYFVFVQKKQVQLVKVPSNTLFITPILSGFHTKEIYSFEVLPLLSNKHNVFISGGEDCTLHISYMDSIINESGTNLKLIDSLDGHLSSIKCISVINLSLDENSSKNLVFTGGGRAQLKIWEVNVKTNQDTFSHKNLLCKDLLSYMLHGQDKERNKIWVGKELMYNVDPETRYMDLSSMRNPNNDESILVFVACSDGYLRTFEYNIKFNEIKMIDTMAHRNRCILKVHCFNQGEKILLMTMATDGLLSFWNVFMDESGLVHNMKIDNADSFSLHKSGINSYDIEKLNNPDEYILVTGGDDNMLSAIVFNIISNIDEIPSIKVMSIWQNSSIHCAQITGIKLLDHNRFVSVGADQKLALYKYSISDSKIFPILLEEITLCVSDIQGIMSFQNETKDEDIFCTYGKGFQLLLNEKKRFPSS